MARAGVLVDAGLVVVIASSASTDELEHMLGMLDVGDAVDATTSADDVDAAEPAPDIFDAALDAGGVDRARCLAIGDSVWDVRAARAAGIGCIAVESGGFSTHELREEGATHVDRDVGEVASQIATGPLAHLVGP